MPANLDSLDNSVLMPAGTKYMIICPELSSLAFKRTSSVLGNKRMAR